MRYLNASKKTRIFFSFCIQNLFTNLDMSDVDTVWTWGGQTSTPPISKYFSRIIYNPKNDPNNPNKELKSVKRP